MVRDGAVLGALPRDQVAMAESRASWREGGPRLSRDPVDKGRNGGIARFMVTVQYSLSGIVSQARRNGGIARFMVTERPARECGRRAASRNGGIARFMVTGRIRE